MQAVAVLNENQEQQVVEATLARLKQASSHFGRDFEAVPVKFDLRGRAAGQYRVSRGEKLIRYNPWIFARYFEHNLENTVVHEVAHYVTDTLYGPGSGRRAASRIRPHGREWQSVMRVLGAEPLTRCDYDLSGLPARRHRTYAYRCACSTHNLGSRRHRRVQKGQAGYYCQLCRGLLHPAG